MKAMINKSEPANKFNLSKIQIKNRGIKKEVEIVDCEAVQEKGQLIISLHSQLFTEDNCKVLIQGDKIRIIISEFIDTKKLMSIPRYDWQSYYQQPYVRMFNVSILLPGDNFFLLRYFLIPENFVLKIFLGQMIEN